MTCTAGCVLYEIATGAPPFDLDDAWAVLVGHRDTPPEPLRTHRAELPDYLDRIVLDLLAKTPEGRPTDATDLRRRIVSARTGPDRVSAEVRVQQAAAPRLPPGPGG